MTQIASSKSLERQNVAARGDKCCNCSQQTSEVRRAENIEKKGRKGKAGHYLRVGRGASAPTQKMENMLRQAVSPRPKWTS